MERKQNGMGVVRCAVMLVVLSLGLSGCETCRKITQKIPFIGRKPSVVETLPPEIGTVQPPPLVTATVPKPQPPTVEPIVEDPQAPRPETEPKIEEALQTVHFDYDSAVLRTDAQGILDTNIAWLKQHPDVRIQLEGHCDERGTEEYNFHLGERRAESVKRYLVNAGVDPARLFTVSFGEDRPIDPGHDESAWAKNRRVQFSRY